MIPLIPTPRKMSMSQTRVAFLPVYEADPIFLNAAQTLVDFAHRTHGVSVLPQKGGIVFSYDSSVPEEGYVLTVSETGVTLKASDVFGAHNGAVTLVQLMEPAGAKITLPIGTIEDAPQCTWRTVMVDLARNWHEFHMLYEYVDLCRFYKIRYFHLHFTDDQSYTLPSRAFPKLSTEGRSYTEEQLKSLIAYAKLRGVELIPEIDTPGHAVSFAEGYGEKFGKDGVICLSDESMEGIATLFRELCELFADSTYIHMGGDEATLTKWCECEKCLDAFQRRGVDVDRYMVNDETKRELAELMYATFIKDVCDVIFECGKTPVIWEGFCKKMNHMIPRDAVVVSWENFYQLTPDLLEGGFRLVNAAWNPTYIVTPEPCWSPEEIFNWNIYTWGAVHPQSPYLKTPLVIPPTKQVEGGQLLAWGDRIASMFETVEEGVLLEQKLVEERTPSFSENVWNREKQTDWNEFKERLDYVTGLYQNFRKSAPTTY